MSIKYINEQGKNYKIQSFLYILQYLVKRNKSLNFQTVNKTAEKASQVLKLVKLSKYYTNASREIYSINPPAEK